MSEDTTEHPAAAPEGGSPAGERAAGRAPSSSEHRSSEAPFDHSKAWSEAFSKLADLPEAILNALEEKASSKKQEEKKPVEQAVTQGTEQVDKTAQPAQVQAAQAEAKKKPWGARFLEPRRKAN